MNKKSSGIAIGGGVTVVVIAVALLMFSGMPNEQEPMNSLVDDAGKNDAAIQDVDKTRVLASFYPYYEFTRNVAGDSAIVEQYMPSGIEAHDWEPRAQEIQSLKNTDVFVYNGLGMEPYVDDMIDSGEFDNVVFVKASEGIQMMKFDEDGHDDTHAGEFAHEMEEIIEEFEHGHITASQALEEIGETLNEHEGDGHGHGNMTIESIEEILHEIEEGHVSSEDGLEEIHHIISESEGADETKHSEEEHAGEFAHEMEEIIEEFEHGHITDSQAVEQIESVLHEHEGDGHGNMTIEKIEGMLHEMEEGHVSSEDGLEEIHHIISESEGADETKHSEEEERRSRT